MFRVFVPPAARRVLGDDAPVSLLSTGLIAEHASQLQGPAVEVTWCGTSALLGVMRAVQHHGALLSVVLPDVFDLDDPGARESLVRAVADVAGEVMAGAPLSVVRRLRGRFAGAPEAARALSTTIAGEADAGFTAFSLRPAELGIDDGAELLDVVQPAIEMGAGVELEFDKHDGAAFTLAQLDEVGMRAAAIRGAGPDDELCGGLLVVDPLTQELPDEVPLRVNLDAFVVKGIAEAIAPAEGGLLLRATRRGNASRALVTGLDLLAELDDDERLRVEGLTHARVADALVALGAEDVAGDLLRALTAELQGDMPPGRLH
jgi:hypothetical protein